MILPAALNGDRTRADHPAVPLAAAELARDAAACVAAGAHELHIHPRDGDGRESLDVVIVDPVVTAVREAAGGAEIVVSTAAWIVGDLEERLEAIALWTQPDDASVNVSEDGFAEVMRVLLENGIGVEAGVWSVEDAIVSGYDTRIGLEDTLHLPDGEPGPRRLASSVRWEDGTRQASVGGACRWLAAPVGSRRAPSSAPAWSARPAACC